MGIRPVCPQSHIPTRELLRTWRADKLGGFGAAMAVKDDVTDPTEFDRDPFAIQQGTGIGCIKPNRLDKAFFRSA
jgi:hypothetical protein